jgi:hypothetical protein
MSTNHTAIESFVGDVAPAAAPSKPSKKSAFDISRYRTAQPQEDTSSTGGYSQTQFPVRKPGSKNFFQAHPDENFYLYGVSVLEDGDHNVHLLDPDFEVPEGIARFVDRVNLAACITHKQGVFVWHFKDTTSEWSKSAKSVLRKARTEWVRIRANMDLNCYMTESAPEELAAVRPKWPNLTFEQILESAFEGRIVKDVNSPVVRELQGLV